MDERRLRFEIRKQKKLSQVVVRTEMKLFMFDKTEDQKYQTYMLLIFCCFCFYMFKKEVTALLSFLFS